LDCALFERFAIERDGSLDVEAGRAAAADQDRQEKE
jgi:hypothetical protein